MMSKMNIMKRLVFAMILGLIGTLVLFSCSTQQPFEQSGELQFQFGTEQLMSPLYSMEDADTVIVSIHDAADIPVYTDLEMTLYGMGGSYVSEVVVLPVGDYTLEKFWVMDNDMVPPTVIFATPEEGSPLAYLVNDPVPIAFSVAADDVTTLSPEVLDTEEYTPEDFGYVSFEPNIVETFSFLISVLIPSGVGYELTDAELTITSGTDTLYDETIAAETTQVEVRDGYGSYDLLVEKTGYEPYQQIFSNTELKGHESTPLVVTLIIEDFYYVDWEATGSNDGSSWANAFTNLQDAIAASVPGIQIWVAEGDYKPTTRTDRTNSFTMIPGVEIFGGFAGTETTLEQRDWVLNVTTLSGDIGTGSDPSDNSYHVVVGADNAVLNGFTITEGNADGSNPYYAGGGMYIDSASPTVTNCTFTGNSASNGGGMYIDGGSPIITNCTFVNNSATSGGGVYNSGDSVIVTNCTFTNNEAFPGSGGGIISFSGSLIGTNCTFIGNNAGSNGGGIASYGDSPTISNCIFTGNTVNSNGGGMFNSVNSPIVTNCLFTTNDANNWGGGIYNEGNSPTVTNCTISDNSAASGKGMYNASSSLTVKSCIIWGNGFSNFINDYSSVLVEYSNIEYGWAGTGNIDVDPLFMSDPNGDYYLSHVAAGQSSDSPCIDAGDPNTLQDVLDILAGKTTRTDGEPDTGIVDMGYHYEPLEE